MPRTDDRVERGCKLRERPGEAQVEHGPVVGEQRLFWAEQGDRVEKFKVRLERERPSVDQRGNRDSMFETLDDGSSNRLDGMKAQLGIAIEPRLEEALVDDCGWNTCLSFERIEASLVDSLPRRLRGRREASRRGS